MRTDIVEVLAQAPHRWSPAAVGWKLGRPPRGPLGQDPDPDVAEALTHLVASGAAVRMERCPVCGEAGELYGTEDLADERGHGGEAVAWGEATDAITPLIEEGFIEVGENLEFHRRDCCARIGRPWRRAPRPA